MTHRMRACAVLGCSHKGGTLMQHKLDGYLSAHHRVVWMCPPHWGAAHTTLVIELDGEHAGMVQLGAARRTRVGLGGSATAMQVAA